MSSGVPIARRISTASRVRSAGVRGDAGVERLALAYEGVERAHRLLERRRLVEAVAVEDVDVVQAHPLQRLVARGDEVLARPAALAVGARATCRSPALERDDELVAVGPEVASEDAAEVALGRAVGRPVVVRQVEVGDATVERPAQRRLLALDRARRRRSCATARARSPGGRGRSARPGGTASPRRSVRRRPVYSSAWKVMPSSCRTVAEGPESETSGEGA